MSYLLDKKTRRKKNLNLGIAIVLLLVVFYFRNGFYRGLSYVGNITLRPVLVLSNSISSNFSGVSSFFAFKNSLLKENNNLKDKLSEQRATLANYNSIVDENNQLKDLLGRKGDKVNMILAAILSKPNKSAYDTLLIDIGKDRNIFTGDTVFALGNVPIGRVDAVYPSSAKVVLFSNADENTEVVITGKNIFMQLVGRGGGNFEMILPRGFTLDKGTEVVLPDIIPYTVGVVQSVISDPRDAFEKALLVSPVNIQELKFVEVKE